MEGRAIDINHIAIHDAMKLYKVRNKKSCFEKVLQISSHMLDLWREQEPEEPGE